MRIKIENEYSPFRLGIRLGIGLDTTLAYDILGNGTIDAPIVIKPTSLSESLFSIELSDSNAYINFTDQKLYKLSFYNCNNISIQNSGLKFLDIQKCQDISLNNVEVKKVSYIIKSKDINLYAFKSNELHIERCLKTQLIDSNVKNLYRMNSTDLAVIDSFIKKHKIIES
jgi:hypothetical protein